MIRILYALEAKYNEVDPLRNIKDAVFRGGANWRRSVTLRYNEKSFVEKLLSLAMRISALSNKFDGTPLNQKDRRNAVRCLLREIAPLQMYEKPID